MFSKISSLLYPILVITPLFFAACAKQEGKPGGATPDLTAQANFSLARFLTERGHQKSDEPYILPSEVFKKIGKENQKEFVKQVITKFVQGLNLGGLAKSVLERSFDLDKKDPKLWHEVAALNEAALNKIVDEIFLETQLQDHPEYLDRFPTVRIEDMGLIQQALFSAGTYHPEVKQPIPFGLTYPDPKWQNIVLKTNGCKRLERNYKPVVEKFNIYSGMEPTRKYTVDCYSENSEAIAQLLNILSNTIVGWKVTGVTISTDSNPNAKIPVTGYSSFVKALGSLGYTIELYNTRVLVNFLGWSYKDENTQKAIRLATWLDVPIPGSRVRVPAEHGEIDFMIRNDMDMRVAGAQWFFGVPDSRYKGTATFWRPHTYLQAPWADYINEWVRIYLPGKGEQELVNWFNATSYVMKGFQGIYDRFQPPANSYGLFICSDSMTFALAKYLQISQGKATGRLTNVFPTLVTQNVLLTSVEPNEMINIEDLLSYFSEMDPAILKTYAIPDQVTAQNPEAMKKRLSLVFDRKDDKRLEPFADFRNHALQQIRN